MMKSQYMDKLVCSLGKMRFANRVYYGYGGGRSCSRGVALAPQMKVGELKRRHDFMHEQEHE
jgi:hypothetical protein